MNKEQGGEGIRINKYLSDHGVCSRREADRLIEAGRVTIDGHTADTGERVLSGQEVAVDRKVVAPSRRKVILAYNKPVGVICTSEVRRGVRNLDQAIRGAAVQTGERDKKHSGNRRKTIDQIGRVFPVGRLDKDSEGLLLLTNNGEIVNRINRACFGHEKEYIVKTAEEVTQEFLDGMAGGVLLEEGRTLPCRTEMIGKYTFRIILTQGWNRQIRRMCEAFGYHVRALRRIRVMNISLGSLKSGELRELTQEEEQELYRQIRYQKEEK